MNKENSAVQPIVVVLGDLKNISKAYVLLNGAEYAFNGMVEAIDAGFKIFIALGISFPVLTSNVWNFFKTFFYCIEDTRSNTVIRLSSALNKIKLKGNRQNS